MAHTGQTMPGPVLPSFAETDDESSCQNKGKSNGQQYEEVRDHVYYPKSSKWIFSFSTPSSSSISKTALVIMGGPHR